VRHLTLVVAVATIAVGGCHRARPRTRQAPSPAVSRVHALFRAGLEHPAPEQGDMTDLPRSSEARAAWRKVQEDDIYEAVLRVGFDYYRYQFFQQETKQHRFDRCTIFLIVNGKDPRDEFLKRFPDIPPSHLRKASEVKGLGFLPITPATLGNVGNLSMGEISWTSDTSVSVELGYYGHRRAAGWTTAVVVREEGRWVVKQFKGSAAT
jgi:hypothetical protein